MRIIEHIPEMRAWSREERLRRKRIALVPTMGALHEGHLSLVREGRKRGDRLAVSIFVNPAQFGPNEDFTGYPRDLERDRRLLESEGVSALFLPSAEEIYPQGYQTYVETEKLGRFLCGPHRPGHFRGVATVVAKLFNVVRPDVAVFGMKDYQQLVIVRRLVEDLNFDVEIAACPIVREPDGLALSSRNAYLDEEERRAALCLHRALNRARELVCEGVREGARILKGAEAEISREPLARLEYIELCDADSLEAVDVVRGHALLAVAARIGKARLIDNAILTGC